MINQLTTSTQPGPAWGGKAGPGRGGSNLGAGASSGECWVSGLSPRETQSRLARHRAPGGIIGHSSWHHITCCRSLASAWILSDMRTVTSDTEGAGHLSSVWCEKKVLRNFMRCSDVVSIVLYWSISPFVKFDKFDIDIKIRTILTIFIKIKPTVFFVFILNWKIHYWLF